MIRIPLAVGSSVTLPKQATKVTVIETYPDGVVVIGITVAVPPRIIRISPAGH